MSSQVFSCKKKLEKWVAVRSSSHSFVVYHTSSTAPTFWAAASTSSTMTANNIPSKKGAPPTTTTNSGSGKGSTNTNPKKNKSNQKKQSSSSPTQKQKQQQKKTEAPPPKIVAVIDPPLECSQSDFEALLGDAAQGLANYEEAALELLDCARYGTYVMIYCSYVCSNPPLHILILILYLVIYINR